MKEYLTEEEYKEVKQLINYALYAPNKKEAERYISKLQFCGHGLCGRASNIFNELVCYVKNASGRIVDKERQIYFVKSKMYELETYGIKE